VVALCLFTAVAGAQSFSSTFPPVIGFVDLSTTAGATQILGIGDDSSHGITTTVGNALFPAGPVTIGNNGVASAIAGGFVGFTNYTIPAAGPITNLATGGNGHICAFWDDLYPSALTSIWWYENANVLYIMWKDEHHYFDTTPTQIITFEIQVFGAPAAGAPYVQILYPDTTFTGTMAAYDNGASATAGWGKDANPIGANTLYSFDTPGSLPDGTTLSLFPPFTLTASSPLGPNSLQLDFTSGPASGTYFLAVTFYPGLYPAGWLYGVDMPLTELSSLISTGFPFLGPLDPGGNFALGPFGGIPSGLTFFAVGLGIPLGSPVPTVHTPAISYVIP
jgi:hypothetical protein